MADLISSQEAARRLGISSEDIAKLVSQEILHPAQETSSGYQFTNEDIERIASNREPTISDEAAQVGVQIQQEVAYSVSALQQLKRRLAMMTGLTAVSLLLSVVLVTAMFKLYPRQTSDFFGYYYRFNAGNEAKIFSPSRTSLSLAGATIAPDNANTNISLAASLAKPIAAMSLLVVKATDGQQYKQIVEVPAAGSGTPGSSGRPGDNGLDGRPGTAGLNGQNGSAGTNGTDGTEGSGGVNGIDGKDGSGGVNGIDGTDGLSVADVTTTVGDIIIRDASNLTTRLGAGNDGLILTINGGVPAWMNPTGLTAESDTLASVTGRGASTSADLLFGGGLTFSGSVTLSGLTDCPSLATDSSGVLQCSSPTSNTASFSDINPAADAENDTTKLFNDTAQPNITPRSSGQPILLSIHVRFKASGNQDTYATVRIVRNIGSAASCSGGTQVGDAFTSYLTNNNDSASASGTFLDYPATTNQVYYTVCSSSYSNLRNVPTTDRIDVTLVGIQ